MNEDRCCKKIFLAKPMGNRPRGRPPLRWIDCVEKDLKILKVKYWQTVAKSGVAWRRPGPTQGCRAIEEVSSGREVGTFSPELDYRLEWKAAHLFCSMLGSSFVIKSQYFSVFVLYVSVLPFLIVHMYLRIKHMTTRPLILLGINFTNSKTIPQSFIAIGCEQ
ncbi:hypothetical protein TNCV_5058001 [Trichonephila clavipes]|nr:hypothetical protein TNCV_5058001 [Trichonephila clavipes]